MGAEWGRGTGAVMGLPKALTGSIVMGRDSANGVLTFLEVQKKKQLSLEHDWDVLFSPFAVFKASGGHVCAGVGAVFKCVKSLRRARTSFKLLRFQTDFS